MSTVSASIDHSHSTYIPPEMIHQISMSLPRTDLLSMATVNRCFQAEAERLLYRSIDHNLSLDATISCLDTLIAAKSKAILVKSLMIDTTNISSPLVERFVERLVERLCDCMPVLSSLTHLELILPSHHFAVPLIDTALKRCTFSLTSLFISNMFNVIPWVPNQKTLKSIMVDGSADCPSPDEIPIYKQWIRDSPPENNLTLCHLHGWELSVIPTISSRWSAGPIREALRHFLVRGEFETYTLRIKTLSDPVLMRQFASSLSHHFPRIEVLILVVKDLDLGDPEALLPILSSITSLQRIQLDTPGGAPSQYAGSMIDLAKIWSSYCPTMYAIGFPDNSICRIVSGNWQVVYDGSTSLTQPPDIIFYE